MSQQSSQVQVRFEIERELLNQFDDRHENRSAAIRALIRRDVARHKSDELPRERLAEAYEVLLDQGIRYDNGAIRCVASDVAPIIANRCNIEGGKEAVKGQVFARLRRAGFIQPRCGYLWIKPRGVDPRAWSDKL